MRAFINTQNSLRDRLLAALELGIALTGGLLLRPYFQETPGAQTMLFLWEIVAVNLRSARATTIWTVISADALLATFFPFEARHHSAALLSAMSFIGFGVFAASLTCLTHRYRSALFRDKASKSVLEDFTRFAPLVTGRTGCGIFQRILAIFALA